MYFENTRKLPLSTHILDGWLTTFNVLENTSMSFLMCIPKLAAIIAELGRQPRFAQEFFIKYQDRILFGKDTYRPVEFHTYFRVLESDDEYFDYFRKRHAFWKMYGMNLPDEVLKKVYYKNALKIIPGIDKSLFPND